MASGRPDWHSIVTMEGWDGSDLVTVRVDSLGQLYALMLGEYASSPKTVALDSEGNIIAVVKGDSDGTLATVALDSKNRLLMYPTVQAQVNEYAAGNVSASTLEWIKTITGTGALFGCTLRLNTPSSLSAGNIMLWIDGAGPTGYTLGLYLTGGLTSPGSFPFVLTEFDEHEWWYTLILGFPISFDSEIKIGINNVIGAQISYTISTCYGLI